MQSELTMAAKIFLALELDKAPKLRRIAAYVAGDYWMELHRYGECQATQASLERLMSRFRLGDYICALSVHYPINQNPAGGRR